MFTEKFYRSGLSNESISQWDKGDERGNRVSSHRVTDPHWFKGSREQNNSLLQEIPTFWTWHLWKAPTNKSKEHINLKFVWNINHDRPHPTP